MNIYWSIFNLRRFMALRLIINITLGFIIALSLIHFAQAEPTLNINVKNAQGRNVNLSEFKGKVVYVDFWASWCGPCKKSFPWMQNIYAKYKEYGLEVVAINLDSEKEFADEFLKQLAMSEKLTPTFPIRFDPEGEVASEYELQGMPSSYIFNRKGQLVKQHVGFFKNHKAQYEQELVHFLKE